MRSPVLFSVVLLSVLVSVGAGRAMAGDGPGTAKRIPSAAEVLAMDPQLEAVQRAAFKQDVLDKGGFFPRLGNWFDQSMPGWGFDIQAIGNTLFAVWFTYNPDGTPTWYIIVGDLAAKGGGMNMSGNIESFTWDTDTQTASSSVVGTMEFAFADPTSAKAVWTLNGEDGVAPISFAAFAPGIAFTDMTGHYFQHLAPGWGFTMLTQGDFTVLTFYWYVEGQPVWSQGVFAETWFSGVINMNYFLGPGLCPGCLDDQKLAKGFETEPLGGLQFNYGGPNVPVDVQFTNVIGVNPDLLGPFPFGELAPLFGFTSTSSITSNFVSHFDPDYGDFMALAQQFQLGTCLPFEYDTGFFDTMLTGQYEMAYVMLDPSPDGGLPVYADAGCTQPFDTPLNIDGLSYIWGAATGPAVADGDAMVTPIQIAWGGMELDSGFEDYDRVYASGGRWVGPAGVEMRLYGSYRGLTSVLETDPGTRFFDLLGGFTPAPGNADISSGTQDNLSLRATY